MWPGRAVIWQTGSNEFFERLKNTHFRKELGHDHQQARKELVWEIECVKLREKRLCRGNNIPTVGWQDLHIFHHVIFRTILSGMYGSITI